VFSSKALDLGGIPVGVPQTSLVTLKNTGLHDAMFQVSHQTCSLQHIARKGYRVFPGENIYIYTYMCIYICIRDKTTPKETDARLAVAEREAYKQYQPFAIDAQAVASHSWPKVKASTWDHKFHAVSYGHNQTQVLASAAYARLCFYWHEGH